jgi:alanine racemase
VSRWAWAEIDLGAVEHNVAELCAVAAPAQLWAVVKANGYGHGAIEVARAALRGGAAGLCVALVQEGAALRAAGVECPILVLSEQPPDELVDAVSNGLELTVYSMAQLQAIAAAGGNDHPVHLKIDTGMHRVGASPDDALLLGVAIAESSAVRLSGVCTHLAVADEPSNSFTALQLQSFDEVVATLAAAGHYPPMTHAANSAAAIAHPTARYSMVRVGIAVYGISTGLALDGKL